RKGEGLVTSRLPAWLEVRDGKIVLIPDRAAVVRRIFGMAGGGYGLASIVKRLTAEKVPVFGECVVRPGMKRSACSGVWVRAYVAKILKDRRALGEFQPRSKNRKSNGPPILDYFPRVVTEDEFEQARAGARERQTKPGRLTAHINVFSGLIRDARDGSTYFVA